MADINKFQRSKDRIIEVLNYLMSVTDENDTKVSSIYALERSIQILDNKIEEFKRNNNSVNN